VARILIGVSGGIAAYKAVELARLATQAGHGVRVTMTDAAARFVGAATFEGITGAPVLVDEFSRDPLRGTYPGDELPAHDPISHLAVVERADAFVVAPASANTLAKLAAGICDSLLTTSFLACTAPRIVAPAMNGRMWEAAATGANVATLRERGIEVMEPGEGALASRGEHGRGRMPEPEEILAAIEAAIGANPAESAAPANPADLAGRRVLVTAGGTREQIDPVRFVGNRSSGRMGYAVAAEAARRGARVTLVSGPTKIDPPRTESVVQVRSAAEMHEAVLSRAAAHDVIIMAAAVADYTIAMPEPQKIAKRDGPLTLTLTRTRDILGDLGRLASRAEGRPILVGFAAETHDVHAHAREKLDRKGIDLMVANDVSQPGVGFDTATNAVSIIARDGIDQVPLQSKSAIASRILDRIEVLLTESRSAALK
jgi:phosphopantothenoylcysteine decarboxylase / phosphopantothenate---cysteine ligase